MRSVLTGLVVVGMLATRGVAVITVRLLPASSIVPATGGTVTITIQAQGGNGNTSLGEAAIASIAGGISTSGTVTGAVSSNFAFAAGVWAGAFVDAYNLLPTPQANGALSVFGTGQNTPVQDVNTALYGLPPDWSPVATFDVSIPAQAPGRQLTLEFYESNDFTVSTVWACVLVMGQDVEPVCKLGATIKVVPSPDMQAVLDMAAAWGASREDPEYNAACDLNADGWIDVSDLMILVLSWGG
jgi:hypothetical protein